MASYYFTFFLNLLFRSCLIRFSDRGLVSQVPKELLGSANFVFLYTTINISTSDRQNQQGGGTLVFCCVCLGGIIFYPEIGPQVHLDQFNRGRTSHGRYNLTIQSMIEFRLKMIQFNFRFKRKLSKIIQFNFQFKRELSGFNSKKYSIRKKPRIQFKKILNSKLFLPNSIQ